LESAGFAADYAVERWTNAALRAFSYLMASFAHAEDFLSRRGILRTGFTRTSGE